MKIIFILKNNVIFTKYVLNSWFVFAGTNYQRWSNAPYDSSFPLLIWRNQLLKVFKCTWQFIPASWFVGMNYQKLHLTTLIVVSCKSKAGIIFPFTKCCSNTFVFVYIYIYIHTITYCDWAKRTKFLLAVIYGLPRGHSNSSKTFKKNCKKLKWIFMTISGLAESFKTMNWPDPTRQ